MQKAQLTIPANMIPYFSDGLEMDFVHNASSENKKDPRYFFINNIDASINEIIETRYVRIQEEEKLFIENLGMKFSEK